MKTRYPLALFILLVSCKQNHPPENIVSILKDSIVVESTINTIVSDTSNALEQKFIAAHLVAVNLLCKDILVDLKYASDSNFLQTNLYGNLSNAYMQCDAAEKLVTAQSILRKLHPTYSFIVFDAARPVSVQMLLWKALKNDPLNRGKYVSNPERGSLHNYGVAVDISISDSAGIQLDMGTPFDYFGELAYPIKETQLLQEKKLTAPQIENRKLLRKVMNAAGFFGIQTEWWHFNACNRAYALENYELIE